MHWVEATCVVEATGKELVHPDLVAYLYAAKVARARLPPSDLAALRSGMDRTYEVVP